MKPLTELRLFYIAVGLCLVFSIYASYQANHRAYQGCRRIEVLKSYAYDSVIRSQHTLPLSAYYLAHPEELRDVMKNLALQKDNFSPKTCHVQII